jgi:8-oxoguanine DNA glycosylase-like protein
MTFSMHDWEQLAAQAEEKAALHPLKAEHEPGVTAAIEAARRRRGGDSVAGHPVEFNPKAWMPVHDALPAHCLDTGIITRGDVFAVAADRDAEDAMWRLFVSSYVWGHGKNGYGLSRLTRIERHTPKDQLTALIEDALKAGADGPMAAYYKLRGEIRDPVAAKYWGSAFFTKALYFGLRDQRSARPALILDEVMASHVAKLSDLPHMLDRRGKAYHWGYYRYGVYLAWMGQTAERFEVSSEFLEYSLFTS